VSRCEEGSSSAAASQEWPTSPSHPVTPLPLSTWRDSGRTLVGECQDNRMCGASILVDLSTRCERGGQRIFLAALHWYCQIPARERFDSTVPRSPPAGCRGGWGGSWLQTTGSLWWPGIGRQPDSVTQRRWAPEQSARGRARRGCGANPTFHRLQVERWLPLATRDWPASGPLSGQLGASWSASVGGGSSGDHLRGVLVMTFVINYAAVGHRPHRCPTRLRAAL
jgi:hypothetical protein